MLLFLGTKTDIISEGTTEDEDNVIDEEEGLRRMKVERKTKRMGMNGICQMRIAMSYMRHLEMMIQSEIKKSKLCLFMTKPASHLNTCMQEGRGSDNSTD